MSLISRRLLTAGNKRWDRARWGLRTLAALLCFAALLTSSAARAQISWPKFHKDAGNTGQVTDTDHIPGFGMEPRWTFPWPAVKETDDELILDDSDGAPNFVISGSWVSSDSLANKADNANEGNYFQAPVRTPKNGVAAMSATWIIPAGQAAAEYLVYVWFPSGTASVSNSQNVTYTIEGSDRTITATISQSESGRWVLIGGPISLKPGDRIVVSNYSDVKQVVGPGNDPNQPNPNVVYVDDGRYVQADAVRLVRNYGSIYSSPVVFDLTSPIMGPDGGTEAVTKATVFGTVEQDPFGRQTGTEINWAHVYAVDAINGPGYSSNPNGFHTTNAPLWKYPRDTDRDPLEGPITGGIFGTPLVADTASGRVVYVAADDSQIYALDSRTGRLIWSGPGQTLDDTTLSPVVKVNGFTSPSPFPTSPYYFGKEFKTSDINKGHSVEYNFGKLKAYNYDIYAWIPPQPTDMEWVFDANYEVEIDGVKTSVKVDQSGCASGGVAGARWVKVGTGWSVPASGVVKVTLSDASAQTDPCDTGKTLRVVADAIRIIPSVVGPFGYTGIASDNPAGTTNRLFCANSSGRIISLSPAVDPDLPYSPTINWIVPAVRPESGTFDLVSLGGMSCTVAIDGDYLYYGTSTGKVGRYKSINSASNPPEQDWSGLKDKDDKDITITSILSSPMVEGSYVYFASTAGRVYKASAATGKVVWTYPDDWQAIHSPEKWTAGAFRYSAPTRADMGGQNYIVIGSQDGTLHVIPDSIGAPSAKARKIVTAGAISSSAAVCNAGSGFPKQALVGTDSGTIVGINIDPSSTYSNWAWTTLADQIFSSPAVSDHRVFVGGDDGRMYAFYNSSHWGGEGWPNAPDVGGLPGSAFDDSRSGQNWFDVELVSKEVFDNVDQFFEDPGGLGGGNRKDFSGIAGPSKRFEWGETIYVIAYAAVETNSIGEIIGGDSKSYKNATVRFEMLNVGQGEEAGALMSLSQMLDQRYPVQVDSPIVGRIKQGAKTLSFGVYYYTKFAFVLDPNRLLTPGSQYTLRGTVSPTAQARGQQSMLAVVPRKPMRGSGLNRDPLYVSINNPLAISFTNTSTGVARTAEWGSAPAGQIFTPQRSDPGTDYNGMGTMGVPLIAVPSAKHGANSIPQYVFLADRSMLGYTRPGNTQGAINSLRAGRGDLIFSSAAVNPLPWEEVPNTGVVNTSRDYPDMAKTLLRVEKELDGADPASSAASLLPTVSPVGAPTGNTRRATPDPLSLVVEVPKYQPASRYGTRCQVWIDAKEVGCDAGQLDLRDRRVVGRPLRGSEVYREWDFALDVDPDVNIYAVERTVDLGKRPEGFGMFPAGQFLPFAGMTVPPGIPSTELFRTFNILSDSNVNVTNVQVYKNLQLFSDQVQAIDFNGNGILDNFEGFALPGGLIVSSLDSAYWNHAGIPVAKPVPGRGYVISKPLVGDTAPTILSLPDKRYAEEYNKTLPPDSRITPVSPMISIALPYGTPAGTYSQVVPVYADLQDVGLGIQLAKPAFTLKITAREARLTDGATDGSLPQVDIPPVDSPSGDAQPTAVRLWKKSGDTVVPGSVLMFWASNRYHSNTATAQPWYLYNSLLEYDLASNGFAFQASGSQWWHPVDAGSAFPVAYGTVPSALFPSGTSSDTSIGLPGVIVNSSIKFTSPSIGQDEKDGKAWIVFLGQVDKQDGARLYTEYRIFYAQVNQDGSIGTVSSIPNQDFTIPKFAPRIIPITRPDDKQVLYLLFHAGLGGQQKMFFTYNENPGNASGWSRDAPLTIPAAVTAAADPVGFPRHILPPNNEPGTKGLYIDVVFSGISRHGSNSDIMLVRYQPDGARLRMQSLPRVFGEELRRDTKQISMFYSVHLGWRRPNNGEAPGAAPHLPNVIVKRYNAATKTFTDDLLTDVAAQVDERAGLVIYDNSTAHPDLHSRYGRVVVDVSAGTVKLEKPVPNTFKVVADYTPQAYRLNQEIQSKPDTAPYAFIERTRRHPSDKNLFGATGDTTIDRMWIFWREGPGAVHQNTIYYKTLRLGLKLGRPVAIKPDGLPAGTFVVQEGASSYDGPYEFDWANNRVLFTEDAENRNIRVRYTSTDGKTYEEPRAFSDSVFEGLGWITESNDEPLMVDSMVNEGQVFAFADPDGLRNPLMDPLYRPTKIWVFWSSSRAGTTDLYSQTISPNFRAQTVTRSQ